MSRKQISFLSVRHLSLKNTTPAFLDINKCYVWWAHNCVWMLLKSNAECMWSAREMSLVAEITPALSHVSDLKLWNGMPSGSIRHPECYKSKRKKSSNGKRTRVGRREECKFVLFIYRFVLLKKHHQLHTEYIRIRNVNPTAVLCLNHCNKVLKNHLKYYSVLSFKNIILWKYYPL